MRDYCIGIDIGTTAIKGVLTDRNLHIVSRARCEHHQYFPQPGWVEQDPDELVSCFLAVARDLIDHAGITPHQVAAIGLDHQGETCLIWEKKTGKCVYRAITWQDRRMAEAAVDIKSMHGDRIQSITGLQPDSYYSAFKFRWILDHIPDGQERARRGELAAGTLDSYLVWRLTGGQSFTTDPCSASCTMLFDPRGSDWDPWLLELFDLPRCLMAQVLPCDSHFGMTDPAVFFGAAVPITATIPDSHAGMTGIDALPPGNLTVSYGTGCFMHFTTGSEYITPQNGLTASSCCALRSKRFYQLNGICYTAGSAIKWLQDGIQILEDDRMSSDIALSVPDTAGVSFVPAFSGLAMPYWDQDARGAFLGLTAGVTRAHLIRAVLESIALQVAANFEIMCSACSIRSESIFAMGGITQNEFLMQFQADLTGVPVILPAETEPCFGASRLAWASLLQLDTPSLIGSAIPPRRIYYPQKDEQWRRDKIAAWQQAVSRCLTV